MSEKSKSPYRVQFWALCAACIITLAFIVYAVFENAKTTYRNEDYIVHTIFKDDVYMVANVRTDNELRAKLIRYETALENELISDSRSIFRKFDIDGERIIEYVWEF